MSKKYHVGKNGPAPCNATKRACRYGEESHHDTFQAAEHAYMVNEGLSETETITKAKTKEKLDYPETLQTNNPKAVEAWRQSSIINKNLEEIQYSSSMISDHPFYSWERHEKSLNSYSNRGMKRGWVKEANKLVDDYESIYVRQRLSKDMKKNIWKARKEILDFENDDSNGDMPEMFKSNSSHPIKGDYQSKEFNATGSFEDYEKARKMSDSFDSIVEKVNSPVLTATFNKEKAKLNRYAMKGDFDSYQEQASHMIKQLESYREYDRYNSTIDNLVHNQEKNLSSW